MNNNTKWVETRPYGMATMYLGEDKGPYQMVTRGRGGSAWCYIYKGRQKVLDCNPTYAAKHFPRVANKNSTRA